MAWGAVLVKDGLSQQTRDYWINLEGDINPLESRALCNTLISFFPSISNARSDVWTNNVTLPAAWENGGCRSSLMKKEFKNTEEMSRAENFALHLKYVPSDENIADASSHRLFLVRGDVGPSFKRGLDHGRLTWCLWTATDAEEGVDACCLITRLSRLRILQELMLFTQTIQMEHNVYVRSSFRFRGTFVAVLFWLTLVFRFYRHCPSFTTASLFIIGWRYSKLWQ